MGGGGGGGHAEGRHLRCRRFIEGGSQQQGARLVRCGRECVQRNQRAAADAARFQPWDSTSQTPCVETAKDPRSGRRCPRAADEALDVMLFTVRVPSRDPEQSNPRILPCLIAARPRHLPPPAEACQGPAVSSGDQSGVGELVL